MKKLFKNKKIKNIFFVLLITLFISSFLPNNNVGANPDVTVTPFNSVSVSIDTTSASGGTGDWVTLSALSIVEGAAGDIGLGMHTLNLPTGWEFDTGTQVVLSTSGKGLTLSSLNIYPDSGHISFFVNQVSSQADAIFFGATLKVRPSDGNVGSENITMTHGNQGIAGVDGETNFGTLETYAGVVAQVDFSPQPVNTVYGDNLNSVVVLTQDQFGNTSTSGLGANENVTISLTGTGDLSGTDVLDIGTAVGNGSLTFSDLKISSAGTNNYLTATSTNLLGNNSDYFDVTAKPLIASITVADKIYDGNTSATITLASLNGVITGDTVGIATTSATATFATSTVGNNILVSATGLELTGAYEGNYSISGNATTTADITPKELTIGGTFVASNKVYDGNTNASTTDTTNLTLPDIVGSDIVNLTGISLVFATSTVDTSIIVSIDSADLAGADSGNYSLSLTGAPTSTADITQKELTIGGSFTVANKVYDGDITVESATTTSLTLIGLVDGDGGDVDLSVSESDLEFASSAVNTGITVNIMSGSLSGDKSANYELSLTGAPTSTADITQKELTIGGSFTVANKVYDGDITVESATTTSLTLIGLVEGDGVDVDLSVIESDLEFASSTVNTDITVNITSGSLSGDKSANYELSLTGAPTSTADITQKSLIASITVADKVYDGNTSATITETSLDGIVSGDTVNVSTSTATSTFATSIVGDDILVIANDLTLDGADEGNYSISGTATTTADITPKELTIGGSFTVNNKVYDRNTTATMDVNSLTLTGIVSPDVVTLTGITLAFDSYLVATGTTVNINGASLAGANSNNYTVSTDGAPTSTADITQKPLTAHIEVADKIYDGNTSATITLASLNGVITGDTVGIATTSATATFATSTVGIEILVSATGLTLTGADLGNYSYNGLAQIEANIFKATPVITWATPDDIVAGTALSGTQLNATSAGVSGPLDGSFVYDPLSGTELTLAGSHTLETEFTPTDTVNYNNATSSVNILVVPAIIYKFEISADPTTLAINEISDITVNGKDVYDNIVTNNSSSQVNLMSDDNVNFGNALLTLTEGIATTTLTRASAGIVNITAFWGSILSDQVQVTFSSDTLPVISSISLDKPVYRITQDPNVTITIVVDGEADTVLVNDEAANEDPTGTWTRTFEHGKTEVGMYSLNIVVDKQGNQNLNTVFYSVVSDDSPAAPEVSITSPEAGDIVSGEVTITTVNGDEYQVDGGDWVAIETAWDTTEVINGSHIIRARGTDDGITGYSDYIMVIVQNLEEPESISSKARLVKKFATKNGVHADGWRWEIDVTLPSDVEDIQMSFDNLTGVDTILATNFHFYSAQSVDNKTRDNAISITAAGAGVAWSEAMALDTTLDLKPYEAGRQIIVIVEVAVPEASADGYYSASYDIRDSIIE
jgi:hypothetical protein